MNLPADTDTIAAIATAAGPAGVGIIRLSGSRAWSIAEQLADKQPEDRKALFVPLRNGQGTLLDEALLLGFRGPRSFTGEDVVEFHCHGGPVLLSTVLRECIDRGARHAGPGEFSQRAFLHGKIDLVQAEAIADLIASSTEAAARSASRSLSGVFSEAVNALLADLIRLRVFVEAAIDFPEEEIDFIAESDVLDSLEQLEDRVADLLASARRGRRLRDGLKLVLAGAPNAGKSSLLNRLAEQDTAIVTDIPGTTRDVLREHIQVNGLPLHIVDTAGLRDAADEIEIEGIRRAKAEMTTADRILLVIDDAQQEQDRDASEIIRDYAGELPDGIPVTLVRNKVDLSHREPARTETTSHTEVALSARDGAGMDLLRQHLLESAGLADGNSSDFSARERHITALEDCAAILHRGHEQLRAHGAAELIAEDLRKAQDELSRITGEFSSDDLLGEIFSSFCIGK